jgi:hypothetical protein
LAKTIDLTGIKEKEKKGKKKLTTQDIVGILSGEYNILWQGTPSIIQPKQVR